MATDDEQEGNVLRPQTVELVPETGYLVANLNKQTYGYLDQPVRYQGRVFQPKSELHITLISQDAEKITRYLENNSHGQASIQEMIGATDWRFTRQPTFYHVEEAPGEETIIQMVEIPSLGAFFRELSGLVGQDFTLPPTHVTLYTRGTEKGIGLPTQRVFQELVRAEVQPEEMQPVEDAPGSQGPA